MWNQLWSLRRPGLCPSVDQPDASNTLDLAMRSVAALFGWLGMIFKGTPQSSLDCHAIAAKIHRVSLAVILSMYWGRQVG
jgi:hypothetical protein